jgi:hypothetical protein
MLEKPPSNLACLLWSFWPVGLQNNYNITLHQLSKVRCEQTVAIDLTGSLFHRLCRDFGLPDMSF